MGEGPDNRELAAMRERGSGLVHEGGQLNYAEPGGREQFWAALRSDVRDRMTEIAGGEVTEWWANRAAGGSHMAVVLGPAGLCHAEPAVKPNGEPGHRARTARLQPQSLRVIASGDPTAGPAGAGAAPGAAAPPLLGGVLSADFRTFLGNLPHSTQVHLQRPFTPQPDLRYAYYYEDQPGPPHTWTGLCYLADPRTVTFAAVTRAFAPSGATSSWQATCYQAVVAAPMPAP